MRRYWPLPEEKARAWIGEDWPGGARRLSGVAGKDIVRIGGGAGRPVLEQPMRLLGRGVDRLLGGDCSCHGCWFAIERLADAEGRLLEVGWNIH